MMHHSRTGWLVVGAAMALAACGNDTSSDDAVSAADLDGRQFVATEIEGHAIVEGSEVIVSFDDGAILIEAGCNSQGAGFELDDGILRVELLVSTMMACDESLMEQDQLVASIVEADPTVELDGDDLVISSADATISLTERS